jgi:transposase
MELQPLCLDELLPEGHQARVVWSFVEALDLTLFYRQIRAVEGEVGHPPADPKILITLWLFATLEGIGSARRLAKLCKRDTAYMWICGGVSMNYHTLADFRTAHGDLLEKLLIDGVAVLLNEGLVQMKRVSQDGMRTRASAGAASFRRPETLEVHRAAAQEQLELLRQELESDAASGTRREQAARERAAREQKERLDRAAEQAKQLESQRKKQADKEKVRASTTDPEARVMKMGDGGYRPAYNVQFATDTQTLLILGVEVVNSGGDQGQFAPMMQQLQEDFQRVPDEALIDGGFAKKEDIETVTAMGTTVYAPVQQPKQSKDGSTRDPHQPRDDDSPAVAAWRIRMGIEEAKEIYKDRAASVECVNAQVRNRGLRQFLVRGLDKVKAVVLWHALAHNLVCTLRLRAQVAPAPS